MCSSLLYVAPGIEIFKNVVDGLLVVLLGPQTMGCRADCDKSESVFAQSGLTLCDCMGYGPPGSSVCGLLQNTGVGCHSLLQGIFLTQGLNLGLLPCRQILYRLRHQGSKGSRNMYF